MAKTKYVSLLRGINLSGKNKLPMKSLAGLFTDAGCNDVETYIQSDNVIFSASSAVAKRLPSAIAAAIVEQYGYQVSVVIRSAAELADMVDNNPLLKRGVDTDLTRRVSCRHAGRETRDGTRWQTFAGDSFEIRGRHIFLWLPNGVARTKLTNEYFD